MATWDLDEQSGLDEFAEEGDASRRAWSRASFADGLNTVAAEKEKPREEDTPIVWVVPVEPGVSWWRWIAAAAGLAACIALVVAVVMRPRVSPPTQSSSSLPARSIAFAPIALPDELFQVTPAMPASTFDSSATVETAPVAVVTQLAPAPPPPIVKQESKPVETPAPVAPAVSNPPIVPSAATPPLTASARAEATARTPEPAAPAVSIKQRDEREIRDVLNAFRDSYVKLDVASTARLWPGVDQAALSRAFGTLARQQIDFADCSLDVAGQRAKARCIGSLQYVRRVGSGSPQTQSLQWEFQLDRSSGQWLIDRMAAQ